MAFTLRLTTEQDHALVMLASALGVSKQEAAARAIVDTAARMVRTAELRELARREVPAYHALEEQVRGRDL
ncbi:hypothetical protein QVA66_09850 [Staphylococcus chromogenes]|nr:hypothetical protein [Staphylococcus chromogenes]